MPIRINEDGSLPTWRDPSDNYRPKLASDVADALSANGGAHPDLAAHTTLGLSASGHSHSYAATSHSHLDADIPAAIARDSEVTSAIATHAATPHGGGGEAYAVGDLYLTTTNHADAAAVATRHGYGTWVRYGVGKLLLGTDTAAEVESGSATHSHSFTQPADHAALTHSAHAGATVANHTDVTNHVHVQSVNTATTGGLSGYTPDTSTNSTSASGYSTANPTSIGVAAMIHTVGQANAHSDHAAQSHASGAVADGATTPPAITAFIWKRTA